MLLLTLLFAGALAAERCIDDPSGKIKARGKSCSMIAGALGCDADFGAHAPALAAQTDGVLRVGDINVCPKTCGTCEGYTRIGEDNCNLPGGCEHLDGAKDDKDDKKDKKDQNDDPCKRSCGKVKNACKKKGAKSEAALKKCMGEDAGCMKCMKEQMGEGTDGKDDKEDMMCMDDCKVEMAACGEMDKEAMKKCVGGKARASPMGDCMKCMKSKMAGDGEGKGDGDMKEMCEKTAMSECDSEDDCRKCKMTCMAFGEKSVCVGCKHMTVESDCDGMDMCMWKSMEGKPGMCVMDMEKPEGEKKDDMEACGKLCGKEKKTCMGKMKTMDGMADKMKAMGMEGMDMSKMDEGKMDMFMKKMMGDDKMMGMMKKCMSEEADGECKYCMMSKDKGDKEKMMMMKCKAKCGGEMEACKGKEGDEMMKCMMKEMKEGEDNECMMCAKDMMDDDDKMMMCDESCAAEMKACEGKKDNKEEMMRCMREQMAMDTEGKCMMCKKKMDKKDDDKDMMCMDDCKAEMTSCMGEKAKGDEAMKKCVYGAAGKAEDQKCMTCIKSKDMDDKDDKKMCQTQCASEMGVCKKAAESKKPEDMSMDEFMMTCMKRMLTTSKDGECAMCMKKMDEGEGKKDCMDYCKADMEACGKKRTPKGMTKDEAMKKCMDRGATGECAMCRDKMDKGEGMGDKTKDFCLGQEKKACLKTRKKGCEWVKGKDYCACAEGKSCAPMKERTCAADEQVECSVDKDCMGCKGQYCQMIGEGTGFCANCSDLGEEDCGAVKACSFMNAKCGMGFGEFDNLKSFCEGQTEEDACKGCGGKFSKKGCKAASKTSKLKCKNLSGEICSAVPGCKYSDKRGKCGGKAYKGN